jgi:hypothetical protein
MDQQKFIEKWESEIIGFNESLRVKYSEIKKKSGSNNPKDHIWALMNFDLKFRSDEIVDKNSKYGITLYGEKESKFRLVEEINSLNGFHLVRLGRFLEDELKTFDSDKTENGELRQQVTLAIYYYEESVYKYSFVGSHPYNRLAILYKKYGSINDEIRILELAVLNEKGGPKEKQFQDKLNKVIARNEKLKTNI